MTTLSGLRARSEPVAAAPPITPPASDPASTRALVVSSVFTGDEAVEQIGQQAYSYYFVYRAFAPLLQRWAQTSDVKRPESRLDYAIWKAREQGLDPAHLSFLPLHVSYLTARAPNIAFPFWEFPDIPDRPVANNPRNNWVRLAERVSLLLSASTFTRDAFQRAGVTTPCHVVPVPVRSEYFRVPAWRPGQSVQIDCAAHEFVRPAPERKKADDPWKPATPRSQSMAARVRDGYKNTIRPRLPGLLDRCLTMSSRAVRIALRNRRKSQPHLRPTSPTLDLSGIVYTSILNPFDPRKNWQDMLSAFLLALGDRPDVTLVLKLVVGADLEQTALNGVIGYYRSLGLSHRCKLVVVSDYLSDEQMVDLARGSTYYLCTSRAEGACLPLQDFLAAGRPGVAPLHTAIADYFHPQLGFVVASHPEPTCWPHDPTQELTTSWHRIVWQSLHDQLRASYEQATGRPAEHESMGEEGRQHLADYAGADAVWGRLSAALNTLPVAGTRGQA